MEQIQTKPYKTSHPDWSPYRPLNCGEIRVVTLAPGKFDDRIKCHLKTVSLDDKPIYEALSYVWGSSDITRFIYLQGQEFQVTENLEDSLRHLRCESSERVLWIDALCINQGDAAEKAVQVSEMHVIYERTSHLVVWVGEARVEECSELGMEVIRQIGSQLKDCSDWEADLGKVSLIKDAPVGIAAFDAKPWVAVNRLLRRQWFGRAWVVQEICMPDADISFVCGKLSAPWKYVSRASNAIQRYPWGGERMVKLFEAGYTYINFDAPVNLVREIWKSEAITVQRHSTLMMHLWNFRSRECGDPRDKIYAILGICKDLSKGDIKVDYLAPVERVYSEVAKFIIERDRSLTLLSACQSYGSKIKVPSWVPDWTIEAQFRPMRQIMNWQSDRARLEGSNRHMFNASRDRSAETQVSNDLQQLRVRGFINGRVSALGTHIENDADTTETTESQGRMFSLFHEWWPLAKTQTPEISVGGERRFDTFWRTIITDLDSFNQKATQDREGAEFRLWMLSSSPSAFEPDDLSVPPNMQQIVHFLASFQQATANRRFFVTGEGHMGLGPRLTEPGDLVCVLLGSQVPFILRKVENHCMLIGECYCHGIMEGEAVQGLEDGEVALQDFHIR